MFKRLFSTILVITFTSISTIHRPVYSFDDGAFYTDFGSEAYLTTILYYGLSSYLGTTLIKKSFKQTKIDKEKQIVRYMKHNHSVLKRDFSLASGDTIQELSYQLELDESEANLLIENIEGSDEQMRILNSLSGEITVEKARSFAQSLTTLVRDSVEPYRYVDLLQYALSTSATAEVEI